MCVRAGNRYFMTHRNAMKIEWIVVFFSFLSFFVLFGIVYVRVPSTRHES